MEKMKSTDLTRRQILNNHIVLMRKCVRQARVHVINKLTKEIKRLQERKGDPKDIEKSKRKAARLLEEIHIIKHLKEDRVSITALQNKSTLAETLQSTNSSLEDRGLARLIHHLAVQRQVQAYRDENPLWELQIPVLLEKSVAKIKKEQKKLANKAEGEISTSTPAKTRLRNQSQTSNPEYREQNLAQALECSDSSQSSEEEEQLIDSNLELAKHFKPNKKDSKIAGHSIDKAEGAVQIKQLSEDLSELVTDFQTQSNVVQTGVARRRPKSSFFVGGVDDQPNQSQLKTENFEKKEFKPRLTDTEKRPIFKKGKIVNKPKFDPKQRTPRYFDSRSTTSRFSEPAPAKSKIPEIAGPDSTTKLHPSWEAKKRQQTSIINTEFKGKKIKFDDDE